jgi:hypothetical protein
MIQSDLVIALTSKLSGLSHSFYRCGDRTIITNTHVTLQSTVWHFHSDMKLTGSCCVMTRKYPQAVKTSTVCRPSSVESRAGIHMVKA